MLTWLTSDCRFAKSLYCSSTDYYSCEMLTDDVLIQIFSLIPAGDLLKNCSLVCRQWNSVISGHSVWIRKCHRDRIDFPECGAESIPANYFRNFYLHSIYGRNLLRNNCGNEHFKSQNTVENEEEGEDSDDSGDNYRPFRPVPAGTDYWKVVHNQGGGWIVEEKPAGADPVPDEAGCQSCYATSFGECRKYQVIDLVKQGISEEILDEVCPDIKVGEWHAARFDCGSVYSLKVVLQNAAHKDVAVFEYGPFEEKQWAGRAWTKVEHLFTDYPPGVRYVYFEHFGKDTQFWAGHYGSKMTGGFVKLVWKY